MKEWILVTSFTKKSFDCILREEYDSEIGFQTDFNGFLKTTGSFEGDFFSEAVCCCFIKQFF